MYQVWTTRLIGGMKPSSHTARLYTRTLNLLAATAFVIGAALVVTVDHPESVDNSVTAYGNEPWEFVPVAK